ncbi:MAG: T9SS type B sorting domain-containing protein, partial [Bacteroidota bacterium]
DTTILTASSCNPLDTGIATQLLTNTQGCDSLVITTTTLLSADTTTLFNTSCNPLDTGTFASILTNQQGCDSIVIQNIELLLSDTTILTASSCNPLDTGITTQLLTNTQGCDSLVITTTTLLPSDTQLIALTSCDPLQLGRDTQQYLNQFGCDSIVIQEITLGNDCIRDTTYLDAFSCDPNQVGTDTLVFTGSDLLDSFVITQTYLLPSDTTYLLAQSCHPADTGQSLSLLTNQWGCDSLVYTTTSWLAPDTTLLIYYSCDDSELGETYDTLNNTAGCDSILIHRTLAAAPIITRQISYSCDPQDVLSDTLALLTEEGCDSLVISQILLKQLNIHSSQLDIKCFGEAQGAIWVDSVNGGNSPYLYALDNGALQSSPNFANLAAGTYVITVEDVFGCSGRDTIQLLEGEDFTINLGEDVDLVYGDSLRLKTQSNQAIDSFQWQSGWPLSCTDCPSPMVKPENTIFISLTAMNDKGCEAKDVLVVNVSKDDRVYIPNAFSPNEDGRNERFTVYPGPMVRQIRHFSVFDRWGEKVYQLQDIPAERMPSLGWDGRLEGRPMNPAVFVYQLEVVFTDGSTKIFYGDVSLIR